MKKIILICLFVFVAPKLFADVGDTYICESTKFIYISETENQQYEPPKFSFVRNEDSIVFNNEGYFKGINIPVNFNKEEYFRGGTEFLIFIYYDGSFVYSSPLNNFDTTDVINIIANCEII